MVQRGNEISYFEPGLEPFTLNGDYIVDSLPSLIYTDFKRLSPYYDFISVGRTRIADRLCEVIRVVARRWYTLQLHRGWTPNRNYRCGLISLIAMVKRWNNFA